jgi:hypothetical protein
VIEEQIENLLDKRPKDNITNLVHSRQEVVRRAVSFYLASLGDEIVLYLVKVDVESDKGEARKQVNKE